MIEIILKFSLKLIVFKTNTILKIVLRMQNPNVTANLVVKFVLRIVIALYLQTSIAL